jgi:hypothetical protein
MACSMSDRAAAWWRSLQAATGHIAGAHRQRLLAAPQGSAAGRMRPAQHPVSAAQAPAARTLRSQPEVWAVAWQGTRYQLHLRAAAEAQKAPHQCCCSAQLSRHVH